MLLPDNAAGVVDVDLYRLTRVPVAGLQRAYGRSIQLNRWQLV